MGTTDNRYALMRAMVIGAYRSAQAKNNLAANVPIPGNAPFANTPAGVLESIVTGRFNTEMQSGMTLIQSSEAGGAVQFSIAGDFSPSEVVALAVDALAWLQQQADPLNPPLYPKRLRRLRVSFSKATI